MFYVHPDHLGSIHFITDESGSVEQELSFDAWGRHRNATNWGYSSLPTSKFERGYTFHEHLSEFDLINMNGRVYDPMIARFLSPDPVLQSPGNLQNYNRYSYALNNPLIYTDPSGEKLRWPKFRRHHWIPIIGQFNYLMEFINDNTVKLRQNMVDAGIPDFNIGGSVNSDGEVTVYAGIGTGDGNMLAISYNSNNGVGFGNANNSGNNQFYYPSINYNGPVENVFKSINTMQRIEANYQRQVRNYWESRTSVIVEPYTSIIFNPGNISTNSGFELGPLGVGISIQIGFPKWLVGDTKAFGFDIGFVGDNSTKFLDGFGVYTTKKTPVNSPMAFSIAPEVFYAQSFSYNQIKMQNLNGLGIEYMGGAGPIGASYGNDYEKTYFMATASGFGSGIDVGYGTWNTNTRIITLREIFNKLKGAFLY